MDASSSPSDSSPVLTEIPRHPDAMDQGAEPGSLAGSARNNILLFALTLLTTTMAGAYMAGANLSLEAPLASLVALGSGLSFSIPLMLILLAHEMGHYVTARRCGVDVSLPYFIPAPFPSYFFLGTFGAFIRMRAVPRSRKVMFDIGAAGPWAGFIVAAVFLAYGLRQSEIGPLDNSAGGLNLGNSMLFWGIGRLVLGVTPSSVNVSLSPEAFAGWLGFFVTTLNLLPVGQLDGGHVIYALFGQRHRTISRLFVLLCLMMVLVPLLIGGEYWPGWLLWVGLLIVLGLGHPTTLDANTPLDRGRAVAAWLTVALFVLTFTPVPFYYTEPTAAPSEKTYEVITPAPAPAHPRMRSTRAGLVCSVGKDGVFGA